MFSGGKSFVSSPPAFSNDAKLLLLCTGNTVSIFSTSTGLQTTELEGHEAQVTSVIVVSASTTLCSCWTSSLDGKIKNWDFAAPALMQTIDVGSPIHSMVIPSLLSQTTEINPVHFAYVYIEDVKQSTSNALMGQIRKFSLTKSRFVGVTLAQTKKPGSITASPFGRYIGICDKHKLRIWEIPSKDFDGAYPKKIRLHHTKSFTALAFHPTERMVAAGDKTGRILIWRGVGRETFGNDNNKSAKTGLGKNAEEKPGVRDDDDADSCTTLHWHSAQVNVLFFSSDGAYLYSGGREGVLVVWQLDTGKKKFLPRIGSPLLYYTNSPDPTLFSMSCSDNRVLLLRTPSMEILKSISGIKLPSSHMEMYEGFGSDVVFNNISGLIAVPTENYRVQFYSLFDDLEISEVQICERNHQPGDEVTVKVNLVALSADGSTMSTVETRLPEEGIGSLVSLKFWSCSSQSKQFKLSTVIYEPHREAGISSMAFRPTSRMAVSTSYGGDFKVWVCKEEMSSRDQATGWTCHALGSYKKKPMNAATFSSDGSVLAVAADKLITLWDPDRNTLLAVIGDSLEPITNLSFVGKSNYLVSASRGSNPRLTLWNMMKLCTTWSYRLNIEAIACSMDNSTFAVLALSSLLGTHGMILLFDGVNPVPSSTWLVSKSVGTFNGRIASRAIEQGINPKFNLVSAQGGGISFVQSTTKTVKEVLAYVNCDHEYVLLNPHGAQSNELTISRQQNFSSLEKTERSGYASIYGELPEISLKKDRIQFALAPSDNTWKTMFSGPSHSLPPLPKLCSVFLESLFERRPASAQ